MERSYRFAGVEVTVSMPRERFYADEHRLAPFRAGEVEDAHVFRFEVLDRLPEPEGQCIARTPELRVWTDGGARICCRGPENAPYMHVTHLGREHRVRLLASHYPGPIGTKAVLTAMEAEHLIARAGGFVLHCSYIDRAGRAILFTAPSETGKSTQAELWKRHRGTTIINGDRAAVRLAEGQLLAEGIPFAGSSSYCENRTLPLGAIVYLTQAPGTTIRQLRGYEAFARIWEGVSVNTWDREDMTRVSDAVRRSAETVPVYHLACTPDESAVRALENMLESR